MSIQPFATTEIIIGDTDTKISKSPQGDLVFKDSFIPGVNLRDLVSGNIVLDPALMVYIESTDSGWVSFYDSYGQTFYKITIPHNWNLTSELDTNNILPTGVSVNAFDSNNKLIMVNSIEFFVNSITVSLSRKINLKLSIKRVG